MMKIYGSKNSSAARCYWTAAEAGVELEQIPLDFQKNEHKSEAYLKVNPNGKIPTLVDGDVVIWESMAINNYLLEKHKPDLFGPMDAASHAHLLQWSYWAIAHLNKAMEPLFMQKYRGPMPADEVTKALEGLAAVMVILEAHLAGKDYMVANTFTIADINVCSTAGMGRMFDYDYSAYPNVMRWMKALSERPAFKQVFG